jgi:hypothetical protein
MDSRAALASPSPRLPPRRVSRVPALICPRAPLPTTPKSPDRCLLLASLPMSGFLRMGGLATLGLLTRPNRIRFTLQLTGSLLQGFAGLDSSTQRPQSYMSKEQLHGGLLSFH